MARIVVVGGSLGGLMAANLLLRAGHDVDVIEKAAGALDGRGAGIVTHPGLIVALERAGVVVDESLGVRVESRRVLDVRGDVIASLVMPQVLTSWGRLYALLRDAFPAERHHRGRAVTRVDDAPEGVVVHCDGPGRRTFEADLLLASDGIRSAVRAQFAPEAEPVYAGYVAWRGVCDEALLSRFTLESIFDHFGFGLPAGEQLIGYPVAGPNNATARGRRCYNFVWYRAAGAVHGLIDLMTDADGVHHRGGISPNKVSWRHIAAMREAARRVLAPQFAEILEKCAQPFLQPIFDVSSDRLVFGRVALMGDAAFVARPHVGMGVTKAADDAMALVDALAEHHDPDAALAAYQAARLEAGASVVQRGRLLGSYMQAQGRDRPEVRREVQRNPEDVLRQTAIDLAHAPGLAAAA